MNLKNLINVLNAGNIALGSKLSRLLTEDCVILEYTNESVLFIKGGKLVSATFKNPLTENMTPESIIDNDVITVSAKALNKELKSKLTSVIEGVVTGNLMDAEESLNSFCETYYQFHTLKTKCPELFVESLAKSNKGFKVRKRASEAVIAFKAALFNSVVVEESTNEDLASLSSIVENHGIVLALGKAKVKEIVTDSLLGNSVLAESITNYLYTIAEEFKDDSEDLKELHDSEFDLEKGGFPDETPESLEGEDLDGDMDDLGIPTPGEEDENPEEGSNSEFEPFDPSSLSEEDIKELHKATLKGILTAIKDFVVEKSHDLDDSNIPPDLDEKIEVDLEDLDNPETSDARLSEIEARWQEMIGFFLDSESHTPESMTDDFGGEDDIETSISAGDSDDINNMETDLGDGEGNELGTGGEELPPVDGLEEPNPEEKPQGV